MPALSSRRAEYVPDGHARHSKNVGSCRLSTNSFLQVSGLRFKVYTGGTIGIMGKWKLL